MKNTCVICGDHQDENLVIINTAICRECENRILAPDVSDREYNAFIVKLSEAMRMRL